MSSARAPSFVSREAAVTALRRGHSPDRTEWTARIDDIAIGRRALHLGIFVEPFLHWIVVGQKTIESRFSIHRIAPFAAVNAGDCVLLKASAGPIVGIAVVTEVWFYRLDGPEAIAEIRERFGPAMCATDPEFWNRRSRAAYATLMRLGGVMSVRDVTLPKRDRRGWIVVAERTCEEQLDLW